MVKSKRDVGIDITRIIAFMLVPAVHFFMNTEYYSTPIISKKMFVLTIIRTFCIIAVPLFLLITGYLSSGKDFEINKKNLLAYYKKLIPIILVYLLATILIITYRILFIHETITIKGIISNILNFEQYSWYVEMYLGLALLIPFLNKIWHGIGSKSGQRCLLVVLLLLTTVPTVFNSFDLSSFDTLIKPWTSDGTITNIFPDWWTSIFPLTYYFIGAYLKTSVDIKKMKKWVLGLAIVLSLIAFSAFNIWKSYPNTFAWNNWTQYWGFECLILSVLVFLFINSFDYSKLDKSVNIISLISKITFGAYIISWIPDNIIYHKLIESVPDVPNRLIYMPLTVLFTIIFSLILSAVIQIIVDLFMTLVFKKKKH